MSRFEELAMLTKCVGILLMVVGIGVAWDSLFPLLGEMVVVVWLLAKVLVMLFIAYIGYRLLRQRSPQELG